MIETERVSSRVAGEGFLGTGVTYAVFKSEGDLPCCREALMMEVSGLDSSGANSLNKVIGG